MISGHKVDRPSKADLADDIAKLRGISNPHVSSGSSVESAFIDSIYASLTGATTGQASAYRKVEQLLLMLGRTYDPYWDTSETTSTGGGSTITARAYSRIRTALSGVPRCFVINVTDAPVGARWETNHDRVYRYDDTVTGRRSLNDAGPESRVLYYATSNSAVNRMKFIAHATVGYIGPGWTGPWEVQLDDYEEFVEPVPVALVDIAGWNRQHSITEINFELYRAIVERGGTAAIAPVPYELLDGGSSLSVTEGTFVAKRVLSDFETEKEDPLVEVPDELPHGVLTGSIPFTPTYVESPNGALHVDQPALQFSRSSDVTKNRLAERRAVELATAGLEASGWILAADRQGDGVGYDLEFTRGDEVLKVEVKGIQGPKLQFNVTPKEYWRAETDDRWLLVAVTSVLSPHAYAIHVISRDRILAARRVVTGYRLSI
jgi:hypothetical protein